MGSILRAYLTVRPNLRPEALAELSRHLTEGRLRIGPEVLALWRLLHQISPLRPPPTPPFKILNLACGRCLEAETLCAFAALSSQGVRDVSAEEAERRRHPRSLAQGDVSSTLPAQSFTRRDASFTGNFDLGTTQIYLDGVDLREGELDLARLRTGEFHRLFASALGVPQHPFWFRFLHRDATRLDQFSELPPQVDLVFFRHQNFWHEPRLWAQIFAHARDRLAPWGRLIITSYFDKEHDLAVDMLQSLGLLLECDLSNPDSLPTDTPGKTVDRRLAAFTLEESERPESGAVHSLISNRIRLRKA